MKPSPSSRFAPANASGYSAAWRNVQGDFVDSPQPSVRRADELLGEIMSKRGYPVSDFEQRPVDLSLDHPVVVQNHRAAHDIALRDARGEASTEDLRRAMIDYRALFDDRVSDPNATTQAKAS